MKAPEYDELDFDRLRRMSIEDRKSKESVANFAGEVPLSPAFSELLDSLPDVLAAKALKELVSRLLWARRNGKTILWLLGAHTIKVGLAPVIVRLAREGFVTAVAGNGAVAIHDVEFALFGKSSEDVAAALPRGEFGTTRETADFINSAVASGAKAGYGYAEAIARALVEAKPKFRDKSLLCGLFELGVPVTLHPLPGAEVIHIHPGVDGASLGECAMRDFRRFAAIVAKLAQGAVLGWGSAVVMPEVFLKALSAARNLGHRVEGFVAAYFDMIRHYRPQQNILSRPTGGRGFYFVGHHEIMMPLLAAMLLSAGRREVLG